MGAQVRPAEDRRSEQNPKDRDSLKRDSQGMCIHYGISKTRRADSRCQGTVVCRPLEKYETGSGEQELTRKGESPTLGAERVEEAQE